MANEIATKIATHKAKPVALTRKQTLAARDELKELAAQDARGIMKKLSSFVHNEKMPATARVQAGNLVLERYAGKSAKPNEEERSEDTYARMSEGQLLGVICDSLWGLGSEARAVIAETLIAAEQGVRIESDQLATDFDEEALQTTPKPKKVPRR